MIYNKKSIDLINREFEGAIVMANYGKKQTYKVNRIRWDMSPKTYFFNYGDDNRRVSMQEYLLKAYDVKISNGN